MIVEYRGGMKLVTRHAGFEVTCDQPADSGGENTAMTPTQLFVASLAMCAVTYVLFFAKRHDIPVDGLKAEADFQMAKDPYRVGAIQVRVTMPQPVSEEHRAVLKRSAEQCAVENTLRKAPEISITIA